MSWGQRASYLVNTHQAKSFQDAARMLRPTPQISQPTNQRAVSLPYKDE
jgi:hypothetical protein